MCGLRISWSPYTHAARCTVQRTARRGSSRAQHTHLVNNSARRGRPFSCYSNVPRGFLFANKKKLWIPSRFRGGAIARQKGSVTEQGTTRGWGAQRKKVLPIPPYLPLFHHTTIIKLTPTDPSQQWWGTFAWVAAFKLFPLLCWT